MATQFSVEDRGYIYRGREVFIRLSLLAAMAVSCFLLLRPFLNIIVSGIIIAIAVYPAHRMLSNALRGHRTLAAALCTLVLLLIVIVPELLLAGTLSDGIRAIAQQVQAGRVDLPPAPQGLSKLPIIGSRLESFWTLCSTDLSSVVSRFSPQVRERIPALLAASAKFGATMLQFLISILLAGFFLATSEKESQFADRLFARIFAEQGPEYKELVTATVRSVTNGILGVAVIQTLFASLGFWFVGLAGAGLWAGIFLIAAILQMGALVLVPAVIYVFATQSTTHAVLFLVWSVIVGLMDNVLKPILLGRGSKVPMIVIFIGVLGGFIAMNLIGLFVGAIVLSVGYKLFIAWLDEGVPSVGAIVSKNVVEQSSASSVRV
ncbi:MAG TPA: AI-2E family transporter [Terracidiphilus sp.]|nr:AI-2E family transporter [Terracidiphilus sp.]